MGKTTVSGRCKTNTFAYMRIGAKQMLEQATQSEIGQLYNIISCLTFSAFTLEAYFNHFGKLRDKNWEEIERKYSKLQKYKQFCQLCGLKYNLKERPYSTMIELFSFRDCMAHGKSSIDYVKKEIEFDSEKPTRFTVGPDWKEYATLENAEKAIQDVETMILELHAAGKFSGNVLNDLGGGIFGVHRHET